MTQVEIRHRYTNAVLYTAEVDDERPLRAAVQKAVKERANLAGANLARANLKATCLDPEAAIPSVTDAVLRAAGLEPNGEYVYGWRTQRSQHVGSTVYNIREEPYVAPYFSIAHTDCHPGLYLAGPAWLATEYPAAPRRRVRCLRSELHGASGKWRAKRLWAVPDDAGPGKEAQP